MPGEDEAVRIALVIVGGNVEEVVAALAVDLY